MFENIIVLNLYTLFPVHLLLEKNLLRYLLVDLPVKFQVNLYKKRFFNCPKETINWFYKPNQYLYLKSLGNYIYLHYDNYKGDANYSFGKTKNFDNILKQCIQESLMTLVSSSKLFDSYKSYCNDKVHYYPNAISRELFNKESKQINKKKTKTIGFIGQLDSTFDTNLMYKISEKFEDYKILLIGPVKNKEVEKLIKSKVNVESTGYVDYGKLPELISKFDVGICPYKDDEFNKYRNPLKIIEYFSYGIPVVSVDCDIDPKTKDLVSIAYEDVEFISLIEMELKTNDSLKINERKMYADRNCWDNRAKDVLEHIISNKIVY
ncbi:glycosyltransferase [Vibrio fluvialis]|uniref:glycosyltransferase n=1 Tax=Vibrio fluvialis TaxID=676 RepID=UPI001F1AA51E|nr:glycosyltransferase [Vibrio fluvialis]MCE7650696.1 glycosyltransferase [Vibrio fluvialis]